jgi:hypothetical protein
LRHRRTFRKVDGDSVPINGIEKNVADFIAVEFGFGITLLRIRLLGLRQSNQQRLLCLLGAEMDKQSSGFLGQVVDPGLHNEVDPVAREAALAAG